MFVLDGGPDLVTVVVVVGEGRVHLGEGDRRVGGRNLGRRHPHLLVPDGHVPDLDAVAEDMRLPAAVAGATPMYSVITGKVIGLPCGSGWS